jgi:hypothetical protein
MAGEPMRRHTSAILCALLGAPGLGCATTNSATLATNQIKPLVTLHATTAQSTAQINITLAQTGSWSHVQLAPGDTLTATAKDGQAVPFSYDGTLQLYTAHVVDAADGSPVTIAFTRATGTPAPGTTVAAPPPIALTAPAAGAQVAYGGGSATLSMAWSNPVAGATVHFFPSPCNGVAGSTQDMNAGDNGAFALAVRNLLVGAPPAGGQCVHIAIGRDAQGTLDPAFAPGGTINASREDGVDVNVTP